MIHVSYSPFIHVLKTTLKILEMSSHPRGQFRGRSNPFRSRGRGRGRGGSQTSNQSSPSVPTYNQISPGTLVSIVLKEDQPTGRQVQGIVSEILTGGNHPRGIKVRLRDGRVGRVQKLCSEEDGKAGEGGMRGPGRNGEVSMKEDEFGQPGIERQTAGIISSTTSQGPPPLPKYQDFRYDGYEAPQREEANLEDYVVFKTKSKGKKGKKKTTEPEVDAETNCGSSSATTISNCPVCGEFEGDELAVAHHVEGHFE